MKTIGIIREFRSDEKRTPLIPNQINKLKNKFPSLKFIVQPSKNRCFSNSDYQENGAVIEENLSIADIIMGVKEVATSDLIENKIYIFFSHTSKIQKDGSASAQGTPGMNKKELLREILKKKITLIDYENIRDLSSKRYLGFGRFAGIVGCYNTLNLLLKINKNDAMPRANELNSYKKMQRIISNKSFGNNKILVTGDGRVCKGTNELLKIANIKEVKPLDFINNNFKEAVYCNIPTSMYVKRYDDKPFNLTNFINYPNEYKSVLYQYLSSTNVLIASHYWDPKSPKLFDKIDIPKLNNLKVIGDITCDLNGSIPSTIKTTTISEPYYYLDRKNIKETRKIEDSIAIMAVDNLPSELPKDSSQEFGDGVASEIIPYLVGEDDGRILRATITNNGKFCPSYLYLNDYINF